MTPALLNWILGALSAVGLALSTVIAALWRKSETRADETIKTLRDQVISSERERIAAEQGKNEAQVRTAEIKQRYTYLKAQFTASVRDLNRARFMLDPGALVGTVSEPPDENEPTGVHSVEAYRTHEFLNRQEAVRARQQPLNPSQGRPRQKQQSVHDEDLVGYLAEEERRNR